MHTPTHAHTETHTLMHTHTPVAYQGNETEEKVLKRERFSRKI